LEQITPNIVATLLKPQVDSITQSQTAISQSQSKIKQSQANIQKTQSSLQKNAKTLSNQQQKLKSDMNNMTNYYKDLSSNMFNQYTMYKTSLANESNLGMSSVKTAVQTAQTSASDANTSASKALDAATKTESIHRDVFGRTSAKVVQNNLAEFEGFSVREGATGSIYDRTNAQNQDIFELEHNVINALNDFNTMYAAYMKCKATGVTSCNHDNTQVTESTLEAKATEIQTAIEALQAEYKKTTPDISGSTFDQNHQAIMTKANEIMSKRAELDAKIANIMQPNSELNRFYDSTIYSKIVLSVLASSLVYYVITE
jgi:ABC-type phosphate transport system auxiliary subunit